MLFEIIMHFKASCTWETTIWNQYLLEELFIGYLNDIRGELWNQTPYLQKVYKEKQAYSY